MTVCRKCRRYGLWQFQLSGYAENVEESRWLRQNRELVIQAMESALRAASIVGLGDNAYSEGQIYRV